MPYDPWEDGQLYTAMNGLTIARVGIRLFVRQPEQTDFEEMGTETLDCVPGDQMSGRFRFEHPSVSGQLLCTRSVGIVTIDGQAEAYGVDDISLRDADPRQELARVMSIDGTDQVVVFSRWVHNPDQSALERMFVVDLHTGNVTEVTSIAVADGRVSTADLGELELPSELTGYGHWGESLLFAMNTQDFSPKFEESGTLVGLDYLPATD